MLESFLKIKEDFFMGEICIQVKNISKWFAKRKVVDDLSFKVYKGEVFGLLGHNGAGKSTTIDMILGLKKCDEGSTSICNMDVIKHRKEVFEKVGVQLQNTQYPNMMKVIEVCMEYASLYKKPADYIQLLKLFKLYEWLFHPYNPIDTPLSATCTHIDTTI